MIVIRLRHRGSGRHIQVIAGRIIRVPGPPDAHLRIRQVGLKPVRVASGKGTVVFGEAGHRDGVAQLNPYLNLMLGNNRRDLEPAAVCIGFLGFHERADPIALNISARLFALLGLPERPHPCAEPAGLPSPTGPTTPNRIRLIAAWLGHRLHASVLAASGKANITVCGRPVSHRRELRQNLISIPVRLRPGGGLQIIHRKPIEVIPLCT